jgi:hypothetical protein
MPDHRPSRRTLLGALAATPVASMPLPLALTPLSEWQAAVRAWRDAETRIAPAHARFDAAEQLWFAVRDDTPDGPASAVRTAMDQAIRDHDHQLDLHEAALDALLNTRAPDLSAIIWKLDLIRAMLGPDWPDLLDFLPADLRAFQGGCHGL